MNVSYVVKTVVREVRTNDPHTLAMWFSTFLAADKGVPSEVRQDGDDWIVVDDEGKAARFSSL